MRKKSIFIYRIYIFMHSDAYIQGFCFIVFVLIAIGEQWIMVEIEETGEENTNWKKNLLKWTKNERKMLTSKTLNSNALNLLFTTNTTW